MNELFIYQLFKSILSESKVMDGRFAVAERFGAELNTENLQQLVTDVLGSLTTTQKYPLAMLMPPLELVDSYVKGWSEFRLTMFFLTKAFANGDGSIKSHNTLNNISNHPIRYDWKDMREIAGNFRVMFNNVVKEKNLMGLIRSKSGAKDIYQRVTLAGNDRLNGVILQFEIELFMPCLLSDYGTDAMSKITIPSPDIHPLHKH